MQLELLANEHCGCGENPLWDEQRGLLFWCDIPGKKIFAYNPLDNSHRTVWSGDQECGAFTLQEDGSILLLLTHNAQILDVETGQTKPFLENIVSDTGRFNDCIADVNGCVFAGTVDWEKQTRGGLFFVDIDGNTTKICDGTACSNGMGFTPELDGLYWADSTAKTVYRFDYDQNSGELSNRRAWLQTPDLTPDGLTVDATGDLWITFYDGACLRRYDSKAKMHDEIKFPAKHVTSCIFGGAEMNELYVTTAGGKPDSDTLDGALFRLKPGVTGQPRFRSKVKL